MAGSIDLKALGWTKAEGQEFLRRSKKALDSSKSKKSKRYKRAMSLYLVLKDYYNGGYNDDQD